MDRAARRKALIVAFHFPPLHRQRYPAHATFPGEAMGFQPWS
jgi:hypothetical protein